MYLPQSLECCVGNLPSVFDVDGLMFLQFGPALADATNGPTYHSAHGVKVRLCKPNTLKKYEDFMVRCELVSEKEVRLESKKIMYFENLTSKNKAHRQSNKIWSKYFDNLQIVCLKLL